MYKKSIGILVALLLIQVSSNATFAATHVEAEAARILKVKTEIAKCGIGEKAKIKVKLQDKSEIKGYVYETGDGDFVVANAKTNIKTTIAYKDVKQVKGKGLSLVAKIGIGVAITAGVIVTVIVLADKSLHDALEGK
jgi:hypothetical protein